MLQYREISTHEKYTDKYQHWCPQSENYAGGDHLISAFREGWKLEDKMVYAEKKWKSGTRPVKVYHFVLVRDDETMIMPVISNPYVERYLVANSVMTVYSDTDEKQVVQS